MGLEPSRLAFLIELVFTKNGKREGMYMAIEWITDADGALRQAKDQNKPLLIDFSAAPA